MQTREACAARLETLSTHERAIVLEFLNELEEFDRRSWYAPFGYSSTFAYLSEKLGMSDGTAFRRIRVARLMRRFPVVRDYLEAGRITLSKLTLLDDVLDVIDLLELASTQSERSVKLIVAELRPEGTSTLEVRVTPLTHDLTEVRMVVTREWLDVLAQVSDVVSHQVPKRQIPDVLLVCMRKAISAHQRRTCGVAKPRASKPKAAPASSRPTAEVRRAVWQRDQGRCTFVAPDGKRCNSRHLVEEHHIVPAGKRGTATVENITLRCRSHNLLAAREDFGERHMAQFRRDPRAQTAAGMLSSATSA